MGTAKLSSCAILNILGALMVKFTPENDHFWRSGAGSLWCQFLYSTS